MAQRFKRAIGRVSGCEQQIVEVESMLPATASTRLDLRQNALKRELLAFNRARKARLIDLLQREGQGCMSRPEQPFRVILPGLNY